MSTVLEQDLSLQAIQRSGAVTVWETNTVDADGSTKTQVTRVGSVLQQLYHVARSSDSTNSLKDVAESIKTSQILDTACIRQPSWQLQQRLCSVDSARLLLGVPALSLSPAIGSEAESGVVFLSSLAITEGFLSALLTASRTAQWLVVSPTQHHQTPAQSQTKSLLVFGKQQHQWTSTAPLWQSAGQWQRCPGYVASAGQGATLWMTGPRDFDRLQRVKATAVGYEKDITEQDWLADLNPADNCIRHFQFHTEGRAYLYGDHVLAATASDGSVKQSTQRMRAGFVFAETNDESHRGSDNCFVGGDLASLRAEAAALDMLVDRTVDDSKLVAFTDSLALMYALEAWDRDDFFPIPELQKHSY
eukprot:3575534-Rhodomonas_salina.1